MILWDFAHLCICPGEKNAAVIATGPTNTIHGVLNQVSIPQLSILI
jgi:hypothetical protein